MCLLLLLSLAIAQDEPSQIQWNDPEAEDVDSTRFNLSVSLGGSYAFGNSVSLSAHGTADTSVTWSKNRIGLEATGNLSQSVVDADGNGYLDASERQAGLATNSGRYGGDLRYDRYLTARDSVYALAGGFRDPFAGHHRRLHEQIGYSRTVLRGTRTKGDDGEKLVTELKAELGLDYAQEKYADDVTPERATFLAGRLVVDFTHAISSTTKITNTATVYENFSRTADLRIENQAAVAATLVDDLSLKVTHHLIFYNQPVHSRYMKFDHTVLLSVMLTVD